MNSVIGRSLDPVAWENIVLTGEQILEWFAHYECGWASQKRKSSRSIAIWKV